MSSDGPALARLRWDFRAEDGELPVGDFKQFLPRYLEHFWHGIDSGTWAHWVAERDGTIVAHMAVHVLAGVPRPATVRDRWGWLTDCYTIPEERSRGHGTGLLAVIRIWAVEEGLELLLVSPSSRSVPFYGRAGFKPAGAWLQLTLEPLQGATE